MERPTILLCKINMEILATLGINKAQRHRLGDQMYRQMQIILDLDKQQLTLVSKDLTTINSTTTKANTRICGSSLKILTNLKAPMGIK